MSRIALVDTSILLEILNVPNKAEKHPETFAALAEKIRNREKLFLPIATIFETGNHIAQNGDGRQKRKCAGDFADFIKKAIEGKTPFIPLRFPDSTVLADWINKFPDSVSKGYSLGDISIICDYELTCQLNPYQPVYIWSNDVHLSGYCRE